MLFDHALAETLPGSFTFPAPAGLAPRDLDGRVVVATAGSPERAELEAFVQAGFARHHGARVRSFLPTLIGLRDEQGRIGGVAGYRPAASGPLYLEQYLSRPVEAQIAARLSPGAVHRADVAEIGNFACRNCVTARALIEVLADWLEDHDHEWAVFTGTRQVRRIMAGIGIGLVELGNADAGCVRGAADEWGRYYETDPRVVASHVPSWHRSPARA